MKKWLTSASCREAEVSYQVIGTRLCKQTDAGRKSRFKSVVVVGNRNGYVGVAEGKAKEVGPAIRIGIARAKMEMAPIRRGCGSWECSCSEPHSVPFKITGRCGSTRVKIIPAPKGLGLVIGDNAMAVLRLVGIEDAWTQTFGETRTTTNYVKATFDALKETYRVVHPRDWTR